MQNLEFLNLLLDLLDVKEKKSVAIRSQKYEKGATLRDQERILEKMVYEKLKGLDKNWDEYKSHYETISEFIFNRWGLEYQSATKSCIKTITREIKLMELGI